MQVQLLTMLLIMRVCDYVGWISLLLYHQCCSRFQGKSRATTTRQGVCLCCHAAAELHSGYLHRQVLKTECLRLGSRKFVAPGLLAVDPSKLFLPLLLLQKSMADGGTALQTLPFRDSLSLQWDVWMYDLEPGPCQSWQRSCICNQKRKETLESL